MRYVGTTARGIRTGIIKEGDNLEEIVVNSVLRASESENFKIRDREIIGVTEAVVGIASGNYVTVDDIAEDIKNKFPNKEVGLVFPILSRNRFSMILKGIARGVDKIYMLLSYPADEVGNHLFSEDLLDKYNIKATFFVLGSSIDANEGAKDILKEEVKRGHAIANHTYGHDYSYLYPGRVMNVKNILSDLEKSQNSMKAVLGKDFSTRVIRFPGGYWSWEGRTAMKEALEQNQYYNVDWNALNKDAEGTKKNAEQLVQCAKESVKALGPDADSVVLLMHDTYGKEETVKALPQIIEYLQSQGFEFRSIK